MELKNLISFGNKKLPEDTAIFNMNPAFECPSEKLGLCDIAKICYAKKAERRYPSVFPYRKRQAEAWQNLSAEDFASQFISVAAKKQVTKLRLSESGDFESQEDVVKAEKIAKILSDNGIRMYTYTARKDLDFSFVRYLVINGSGFSADGVIHTFLAVDSFSGKKGVAKCIADCKKCSLCANKSKLTIEALKH
jgi:hypothetical protein